MRPPPSADFEPLRSLAPAPRGAGARPVVIIGFGRSGTTWVSDIVSKVSGQLILFEPLHPSVTDLSFRFAYGTPALGEESELLSHLLEDVLAGRHRRPWLLRNHVPHALDEMSQRGFDEIWAECSILGFKAIRANFMGPWLKRALNARILILVRHPCAVVASILNRKNFWEFGWPETWELFVERTLRSDALSDVLPPVARHRAARAEESLERCAWMWAVTNARLLADARREDLPVFRYEDFYRRPFQTARELFRCLGQTNVHVHPAHLFTPSMTTLRTHHGLAGSDEATGDGAAVFWRDTLSPEQVARVWRVVDEAGLDLYRPEEELHPLIGIERAS